MNSRRLPRRTVRVLDRRLPVDGARAALDALMTDLSAASPRDVDVAAMPESVRALLRARLGAFAEELHRLDFVFDDCSVGNLVFAGSYLLTGRRFNDAVDDYATRGGSAGRADRQRH